MSNTALTPRATQTAIAPHADELARIQTTIASARRGNTRRAYDTSWRAFADYCDSIGADAENADAVTLARWLSRLQHGYTVTDAATRKQVRVPGCKLATLRLRLAGVSAHFGGKRNPHNPAMSEAVAAFMAGAANEMQTAGTATPEQAYPLSADEIARMCAALPGTLAGARDRAMILIGFYCAMRRGELVALNVSDLEIRRDSLTVHIRAGKTMRAGDDANTVSIPRATDTTLCAACALETWLSMVGQLSGAVFVRVTRWDVPGSNRLSAQHVDSVVKRAAELAGVAGVERISGHSLRAGMATELARAGANTLQIKQVTRHKSADMVARYVRRAGSETADTLRLVIR